MMGTNKPQKELFNYSVDLDKRVRPSNPLRRIKETIDFSFVREEVKSFYGYNGNESVDPEIIIKMMFLLFYDNIASERELMKIIPERLDYMWFVGYGLDDEVPDHSVLSKARARWGNEVFEGLFVRIVTMCVQAGLVSGQKIHMDASLIDANASKDSVIRGSREMVDKIRQAYKSEVNKLDEAQELALGKRYNETVNDKAISRTDPDAALVRRDGDSDLRYKNHRAVDDANGVITAMTSTPGSVKENGQLLKLVKQHEDNTGIKVQTVVADTQYGTAENYRSCQEQGIKTHMADMHEAQMDISSREGIYPESAFIYDNEKDCYYCPAGEILNRRNHRLSKRADEYAASSKTCMACKLRSLCTRARTTGRTIKRHFGYDLIQAGRDQAHSYEAKRDRLRRKHLMEGSFADAANNHGFKRARWRRLWRQQIQDYMIAVVQNVRILIKNMDKPLKASIAAESFPLLSVIRHVLSCFAKINGLSRCLGRYQASLNQKSMEFCST